jgi:hypothetical protein
MRIVMPMRGRVNAILKNYLSIESLAAPLTRPGSLIIAQKLPARLAHAPPHSGSVSD